MVCDDGWVKKATVVYMQLGSKIATAAHMWISLHQGKGTRTILHDDAIIMRAFC